MRDENVKIAHRIGTNTDIHLLTEVKSSLRESEQRYRQLSYRATDRRVPAEDFWRIDHSNDECDIRPGSAAQGPARYLF